MEKNQKDEFFNYTERQIRVKVSLWSDNSFELNNEVRKRIKETLERHLPNILSDEIEQELSYNIEVL